MRSYKTDYTDPDRPAHFEQVRLQSLQLCNKGDCLPATRFEWPGLNEVRLPDGGAGRQAFARDERASLALANQGDIILTYQMADLNADGRQDLIWIQAEEASPNSQQLFYALADKDGTYGRALPVTGGTFDTDLKARAREDNPLASEYTDAGRIDLHVVDYNADGRQEVIARQRDGADNQDPVGHGAWDLFVSEPVAGSGWQLKKQSRTLPFPNEDLRFADLDSDGLSDAFYLDADKERLQVHYLRPDPDAEKTSARYYRFESEPRSYPLRGLPELERNGDPDDPYWDIHKLWPKGLGDFDGDGRMDFMVAVEVFRQQNVTSEGITSVGQGREAAVFVHRDGELVYQSQAPSSGAYKADHRHSADLNGDGLTDQIFELREGWHLSLSTGRGWTEPVSLPLQGEAIEPEQLFLTDVSRDGYPDLVYNWGGSLLSYHWQPGTNEFAGTGAAFSDPRELGENDQLMVTDIDGDGWRDFLVFKSEERSWTPVLASHKGDLAPGRVTAIENGLGSRTGIDYELLTHSDHYARLGLGDPVDLAPKQTCTIRGAVAGDPDSGDEVCYSYTPQAFNTDAFYQSLNDPFGNLPADNEHLNKATSPVLELYTPMPIVTRVTSSAPTGEDPEAEAAVSYYYEQMKFQAGGRGSLGFRTLVSLDEQTGIATETRYRQDWPFIGAPLETITRVSTASGEPGPKLSRATNEWALEEVTTASGGTYYQTYIKESVEKDYELEAGGSQQGDELTTVTTTTEQDGWGNVTFLEVATTGGNEKHVKTTHNDYGVGDEQRLSRLQSTGVTTLYQGREETRRAEFSYYASGARQGLLKTEVSAADSPLKQTTEHYYDDYGNRTHSETIGSDGSSRQSERSHYELGRYLQKTTNALGHVTREVISRNRFGQPTQVADINGVVTDIGYDAFGREYRRSDETGAWSWIGRKYCSEL